MYIAAINQNNHRMKNLLPPKKEWPMMIASIVSFIALLAFMFLVAGQGDLADEMRQWFIDFGKYIDLRPNK